MLRYLHPAEFPKKNLPQTNEMHFVVKEKKNLKINTQFSFKVMIKSHTNAHFQVQHSHLESLESPCSMFAMAYRYDKN